MRLRVVPILLLILISANGLAQKKDKPGVFLKGHFQLPNPTGNFAFRTLMSGVSDVGLSLNFPLGERLHMGFGVNHNYFSFDDLAIPERTNASMQVLVGTAQLGYTVASSERLMWEFALEGGYNTILISSETCEAETGNRMNVTPAFNFKPIIGGYVMSSENLYFGLIVSYNTIFSNFGPNKLCIEQFSGFSNSDYTGNYQMFEIGFGFKTILPSNR